MIQKTAKMITNCSVQKLCWNSPNPLAPTFLLVHIKPLSVSGWNSFLGHLHRLSWVRQSVFLREGKCKLFTFWQQRIGIAKCTSSDHHQFIISSLSVHHNIRDWADICTPIVMQYRYLQRQFWRNCFLFRYNFARIVSADICTALQWGCRYPLNPYTIYSWVHHRFIIS